MAWPRLRRQQILDTLIYFDKFDYPLTLVEICYWTARECTGSLPVREPQAQGETLFRKQNGFYFLPGRANIVKLRKERERISQQKWQIARAVGEKLKKFPTIAAVFVTGALAMNNSPVSDDIDLMLVTYPNTLWLTRAFVDLYLYLKSLRRRPGQTSAPNKICPNLWLDINHLSIPHNPGNSLYYAHEILQAKLLWDRSGVHHQFLKQNSWVKNYLPVAYNAERTGSLPVRGPQAQGETLFNLLWPFNVLFFVIQYLYMLPKMTTERVGPGYAFFHPKNGV